MTEDSDAYKYISYTDTVEGFHRKDAMLWWPLIAQPVALVVVIFTYCYDAVHNPRPWSNSYRPLNPTPSYGLIWLWITGLPLAAAVLWNLYRYIEHRIDEARRARAWPAQLAAKRAAAAEKLRLEREAADRAQREQLAALKAKLEAEARADRCARLAQLEGLALNLRAYVSAKVDFFGDGDPADVVHGVRQALLGLGCEDLGLLRESEHATVREIIGDGSFLPPAPPLRPPSIGPV